MPAWERRFVVSLIVTGVVWGLGGLVIMPADSLHQAIVYFFLMGMAGGAVATYSAHASCTYITISSLLLPSTAWFVFQDDVVLRAMAAAGLVYVGAAYRATRTLSFFLHRTFQLSHELQIANEKAEHLARTDSLTGMRNRRAFYEQGERALDQARRYGRPLSLIMLDIDHFKAINDTWGHRGATKRCGRWPASSAETCARPTLPAGSAARNSPSFCPRQPAPTPHRSPSGSGATWPD